MSKQLGWLLAAALLLPVAFSAMARRAPSVPPAPRVLARPVFPPKPALEKKTVTLRFEAQVDAEALERAAREGRKLVLRLEEDIQ